MPARHCEGATLWDDGAYARDLAPPCLSRRPENLSQPAACVYCADHGSRGLATYRRTPSGVGRKAHRIGLWPPPGGKCRTEFFRAQDQASRALPYLMGGRITAQEGAHAAQEGQDEGPHFAATKPPWGPTRRPTVARPRCAANTRTWTPRPSWRPTAARNRARVVDLFATGPRAADPCVTGRPGPVALVDHCGLAVYHAVVTRRYGRGWNLAPGMGSLPRAG